MTLAVSNAPGITRELDAAEARPRLASATLLIVGFALVIATLILTGRSGLVRLAYPLGAVAIGAWLYRRGPGGYIEFAWWLWQVTPGIRRIVDYRLGAYDPQNPMSLTPFLVGGLAVFGVLQRLPDLRRTRMVPWAVAAVAVLYGYFVGFLRVGPMAATHSFITWMVPLIFGLYVALSWRQYPQAEAAVRRVFVWGSMVLALYGIFQFLVPPEWDRFWMVSSGMYSVGRAFPYEVRVFSLVNAPLPFATIMVAGLFLQLAGRGFGRAGSLALGSIALLLSLVRSVWVAGVVGLVVYLAALPRKLVRPMIVAAMLAMITMGVLPFVVPERFAGPSIRIVQDRLLTFTDLSHDVSYKDRASFLGNITDVVINEPLGRGLGSTGVSSSLVGASGEGIRDFDNGIFAVLYSLGWVGGAAFLIAVTAIVMSSLPRREALYDTTAKAARAVAITSLILAFGANVFEGVSAAVLWSFAGLVVASQRWAGSAHDHEEVSA